MINSLTVDELQLEVRLSKKRKLLQLTIDRGGELVISAPHDTPESVMEEFVREKKFWLYTKLAEKEAMNRKIVVREFVNGEGFPYLGRSYRLLLVDEQDVPLKLSQGRFKLVETEVGHGRTHMVKWYTTHAIPWLKKNTDYWSKKLEVKPEDVKVRDLKFRWGSCSSSGTINFHWATIMLPVDVVEYIIVHELTHLKEKNHTQAFWNLLAKAMPDYENRKNWLASHGGGYLGV
jgi:predicted metal-dependent hydrolase